MDIIFDGTFIEIIINKDIKTHIKKICEKLFNNLKASNLLAPIDRKHFTAKTIRSNFAKVAKMNCVKTIYSNPLNNYIGKPSDQLKEYLRSIGNIAMSKYGLVYLTNKSARDIIFHSFTGLKAYGVSAIKEVLEKEPYGLLSSKMTTHRSDSPSILTLLQQVIDVKNGKLSLDKVTAIGIDSE